MRAAAARCASWRATTSTSQPSARATRAAARPIMPAPTTATRSSPRSPARRNACSEHAIGSTSDASARSRPAGNGTTQPSSPTHSPALPPPPPLPTPSGTPRPHPGTPPAPGPAPTRPAAGDGSPARALGPIVETPGDLVPERDRHGSPRDEVKIRAADAGGAHVHSNLPALRVRTGKVEDLDPVVGAMDGAH